MTVVEISNAQIVIDDADLPLLSDLRWCKNQDGYAQATDYSDGGKVTVRLHRRLMGLEKGDRRQVDHINGDRLDYRRENLRIATGGQNAQNRKSHGATSSYRGVFKRSEHSRRLKPWVAQCRIDGHLRTLGYFSTEEEAAKVAADARAAHMPFSAEGGGLPSR